MTSPPASEDLALVDALENVWESIAAFGESLTDAEWATETDCPGWSVQDNLAHIIGIESLILGRPRPDHVPPERPHLKNDLARDNEVWVDWYRASSGPDVLAEFRAVTAARLAQLREPDFDFAAQTWTPVGPGEVRDQLPFRIFDSWVHEQDMRRAVDHPGGWGGPGAQVTVARVIGLLPMLVAKQAGAPDGTVVVFSINGPATANVAVGVHAGRGRALDAPPPTPTTRLVVPADALLRLATGRGDPDSIVARDVRIEGDRALGEHIAHSLNFLF